MTPHEVLGIAVDASDDQIRAAYLEKVKAFPPDRSPDEFEKIRDAYESLRDPRRRFLAALLNADFVKPLPSTIVRSKAGRTFTGPQLWREVLKAK